MQVQYSERESERGGSGVGLGSRERLAPPSSSSESLGNHMMMMMMMMMMNMMMMMMMMLMMRLMMKISSSNFSTRNDGTAMVQVIHENDLP